MDMERCSTQTALIYMLEKWKLSIDNNSFAGEVLMDLTKAFDAINHRSSCLWIQQAGFVAIMCSYLSNRRQRMKINNVLVLKKI